MDLQSIIDWHLTQAKAIKPNVRYSELSAEGYNFHISCARYLMMVLGEMTESKLLCGNEEFGYI